MVQINYRRGRTAGESQYNAAISCQSVSAAVVARACRALMAA